MSTPTPSTSLSATTDELRAGLRLQLGEEILSVYDRDAAALAADDRFAGARRVGDTVPRFRLPAIRAAGAALVALSPQTPDQSLTLAERHELAFPVLSDAGNAVARVFTQSEAATTTSRGLGIEPADYNGEDSNTLPAASTFVIGRDGVISFAAVSGDYRWRVGPGEVLAALRD
jgi:peroxiredoxin